MVPRHSSRNSRHFRKEIVLDRQTAAPEVEAAPGLALYARGQAIENSFAEALGGNQIVLPENLQVMGKKALLHLEGCA
jgi:hypothetical protein